MNISNFITDFITGVGVIVGFGGAISACIFFKEFSKPQQIMFLLLIGILCMVMGMVL